MFESIEPEGRLAGKRLLTFGVSLVLHTIAVTVIVVIPLMFFNVLPTPQVLTYLATPPMPPPPPPPPPPPGPKLAVPHRIVQAKYYAPALVPKGIPKSTPVPPSEADTLAAGIDGGVPGGVVGGVLGGVPGGVLGGATSAALPPPPPPPPKPQIHKPIRVGGELQASKLIFRVDPAYPVLAKEARVHGIVLLQVTVDERGDVSHIKVLSGHPLLIKAAVDAVRQWKYSPTILNGEPVSVIATVTVNFTFANSAT